MGRLDGGRAEGGVACEMNGIAAILKSTLQVPTRLSASAKEKDRAIEKWGDRGGIWLT